MTMGNDRLETWYRTLVGEQDLVIQVQGVLCSVGRELESFSQACSLKLETFHPLKGDPAACHSDGASCIFDSFIVCITLLIVGVPRMTGILAENPLGSSKTKTTCCSL